MTDTNDAPRHLGATASDGRPRGVRSLVAASWLRMRDHGARPDQLRPTVAVDEDALAVAVARETTPLRRCLDDLRGSLGSIAQDAEHIMVVADADGTLLWIEGHERVLEHAREIEFQPGMRWTEESAGTNAIGTALAIEHAVQIFSAEHFLPEQHPWWCSAAPIHDPVTGRLVGAVDLSGPQQTAHPHSLALVSAAATLAEQRLARDAHERSARERAAAAAAPATRQLGSTRARWRLQLLAEDGPRIVPPGQRPRPLSRRQAEVLALLVDHPRGLTADQLGTHLYDDDGNAVTVRALVSRLREIVGPVLRTRPYRLDHDRLRTDLVVLRRLLERGRSREALGLYRGPVLADSEAPGVERLRDELDLAVRAAAMGGGADAVWQWLATPTGSEDLAAAEVFLRDAPVDDPRRALVHARRGTLEAAWGAAGTPG